jgi:predicted dehydrogenase
MVKVAVVGAGHMGHYHLRTYSELPNVEVVGVCDIERERAVEMAKRYDTQPYTDHRELVGRVDAVSVAVPTKLHYAIAKDFLKEGICCLVEKPLADKLEEAEELFCIAKEYDVVLHVGHVERFNAAVQELKNIVKDPIFIECRRLGPYYNDRTNDCGVILDLLIHDIDIVLDIVRSPIKGMAVAVSKIYSPYEDIASVQIKFESGCIASLVASRCTECKVRTLSLTQKDIYIHLDYATQDLHIHKEAASNYMVSKESLRYKQASFVERLFVHKDNPLKLEILHFLQCVKKKSCACSSEHEIRSLKVALDLLKMVDAS